MKSSGIDEVGSADLGTRLRAVRLPLPWEGLGFPEPWQSRGTTVADGDIAWAWEPAAPDLGIAAPSPVPPAPEVEGWGIDHLVLLVPDLEATIATLAEVDLAPRLRMEVRGRPTAFFRVGPVLEVIQSPVRAPALFGIALVTDEPLETVALRWRAAGYDVADPRPAIQPGRRIMTVRGLAAGLAVMSPETAL